MVDFTWAQDTTDSRVRRVREWAQFNLLRAQERIAEMRERSGGMGEYSTQVGRVVAVAVAIVVVLAVSTIAVQALAGRAHGDAIPMIKGSEGNDTFEGTARADRYRAGGGRDLVMGGGGGDRLFGGGDDDVLVGGPGNDRLWADDGADVVFGGTGDDFLYAIAADAADRLVCGPGEDTAFVSSINGRIADRTIGCEHIEITDYRRQRARDVG